MNILFLVPYPLKESPSQRFRFEQYFDILKQNGYTFTVQSFFNAHNWRVYAKTGNVTTKVSGLLSGFSKRLRILFKIRSFDYVFVHRESAPVGPPIIEWIIAKVLRKKIIYDFDDAIWLTDRVNESWFLKVVKWRSKVSNICKWSFKVSCGNEYLCAFARGFNNDVVLNPTTIDTDKVHVNANERQFRDDTITIGWTGSHSTLKYLEAIEPVLQKIEESFPFVRFLVIADHKPNLKMQRLDFRPWSEKTEITDLQAVDIGLMPLPDDAWSKGKCGFKALQYMALGIPTVASPVGVNTTIITHGLNGLLASTQEEWEVTIKALVTNSQKRKSIGSEGRETVLRGYSFKSNVDNFLALFA